MVHTVRVQVPFLAPSEAAVWLLYLYKKYADVAELADALDSGSSGGNFIWVQVPSSAPTKADPNLFGSALVYVDIKT